MRIIAITSCPTGIAHTYMAAEALSMAAKELGHEIKVETQGSVGAENVLTAEDVKNAGVLIIAADTNVDKSRFAGMNCIEVSVKDAIKDPKGLIAKALEAKGKVSLADQVSNIKEKEKSTRKGPYKHLMTGVSFMIPFVVAGGILIAFSFAFGIKAFQTPGTIADALMTMGGGGAFGFMIPVLAGYIAFSIADRPGLVPGMVGGFLASKYGMGFLGGLLAGFMAGYVVYYMKQYIKLPKSLDGLMPVLILPVFSTLIVGLIMIKVLADPIKGINDGMVAWLNTLGGTNAVMLGGLLGLMMAFDMGGPINKAAYAFATATIAAGKPSMVMAAVMAAGMTPPLGLALATVIAKKKFTEQEREAGKAAWALGISFITEGAIPFAAADPIRVIPSIMAGSAVTGALSMLFKCTLAVPHGGIFVLPIPNAVGGLLWYIVSIAAGTVVTALILTAVKKDV